MTPAEGRLTIIIVALLNFCEELVRECMITCPVSQEEHDHDKQLQDIQEMRTLFLKKEEVKIDTD